ncbi:MAG: D-glycero-beta-D-manno-heptose-7-phosphate kinase [Candidatus Marinimicrobia bacterium]|jgi:rfaE bifunctional protein kinase chain/domain|nr:D-glycero-beta-D-manno-heptose-7-phosphate kinase [Candidatus Neomarinimicrobiota bacterium]|tara:strand:+ start:2836 stop:3819 length:984 start_codon:yes stop_codon:yes gene_type:complete
MTMDKQRFEEISGLFSQKSILVIGDVMLDKFMWGKADRISPEAPVPIISIDKISHSPGGAANVALNLSKLSANVHLLAVVGDDNESNLLEDDLEKQGVKIKFIKDAKKSTTTKTRIMAHGQQVVRTDYENTNDITSEQIKHINDMIVACSSEIDAIIIEDYNKGLLVKDCINTILDIAAKNDIPVYVDPKKENFFVYNKIRLFKPNMFEFESIIDFNKQNKGFEELGEQLRKKINAEILMITRGEEGVTLFTDNNIQTIGTKARKVHDVSGAGDTAISAFVLADLSGASIEESAMISNYAAGRVCEEVGVVPISLEMIKDIVDHYNN